MSVPRGVGTILYMSPEQAAGEELRMWRNASTFGSTLKVNQEEAATTAKIGSKLQKAICSVLRPLLRARASTLGDTVSVEKSSLHSSYERGCQEKKLLPAWATTPDRGTWRREKDVLDIPFYRSGDFIH